MKVLLTISMILFMSIAHSAEKSPERENALEAFRIFAHCAKGLELGAVGDYEEYTKTEQVKTAISGIEKWCTRWTQVWYKELVSEQPLSPEELVTFRDYKSEFLQELTSIFIAGSAIRGVTVVDTKQ